MKYFIFLAMIMLFSISIFLSTVIIADGFPAISIVIKDALGNEINPTLNQQVFFHYDIANGYQYTKNFDLDLFIILDDTNVQIFYKKQQLQLKPDAGTTVTWSFTPTKSGNYTAKIIENGISHSHGFVIEDFSGVIPICTNPVAVAVNSKTNMVYVTCRESYWDETKTDSVYVIKASDNSISDIIQVETFPSSIAVNPNTNKVYVTNFESNSVTVIDVATNSVLSNISNINYHPYRVAVDSNTNMVYVTAASTLVVIDGSTDSIQRTIELSHFDSNGLAINPNDHRAYISHDIASSISVVDTSENKLVDVLTVGDRIFGLDVNPNTNLLYVSNLGNISVLDTLTNKIIANIPTNTYFSQIVVNPVTNKIYTANGHSNSTTVIDGKTNKITNIIEVGFIAESVAVNQDTNMIYVVNRGSNSVSVIDGVTDSIVTEFQAERDILQKSDRMLSPLKQFKSGIPFDEIECKESLNLVSKYNGKPACVKPENYAKLILRGWALMPTYIPGEIPMGIEIPDDVDIGEFEHAACMNADKKWVYEGKTHTIPYIVRISWNPFDLKTSEVVNFEIQMFDLNSKPLQNVTYDLVWKSGPDSGVIDDRYVADFGTIPFDVLPIKTADPCYIAVSVHIDSIGEKSFKRTDPAEIEKYGNMSPVGIQFHHYGLDSITP